MRSCPFGPANGQLSGDADILFVGGGRGTFIEWHHDIAADNALGLDHIFRGEVLF